MNKKKGVSAFDVCGGSGGCGGAKQLVRV